MQTAKSIIEYLQERSVQLQVTPQGNLRYRVPRDAWTPDLPEMLRLHKNALLAELDGEHSRSDAFSRQRWGMPPDREIPLSKQPVRPTRRHMNLIARAVTHQPVKVIHWILGDGGQADRYEDTYGWESNVCDLTAAIDLLLWQRERTIPATTRPQQIDCLLADLETVEGMLISNSLRRETES